MKIWWDIVVLKYKEIGFFFGVSFNFDFIFNYKIVFFFINIILNNFKNSNNGY